MIKHIYWLKINLNNIEDSQIAIKFLQFSNDNFLVHYTLREFLEPMKQDRGQVNLGSLQTLAFNFCLVGYVVHRLTLFEGNIAKEHDIAGATKFM